MFHYQNLLGGHLGGKHPHKPGRSRPELYWYDFSIVCRTQWDIFGRSFHAVKILLQVSASWDWFLDLYVVVQSERCPEMNRQEASELTALKTSSEGAGIQWPLRFRVDAEICARQRPLGPEEQQSGRGWQSGPLRTPKDDGHRKMRCWLLNFGGEVLIGLSPRASGLLPCNLLRNNNGPQIRFKLRRLLLSVLSVFTFLGGEAR